jgi:hypothetical protein
MGMGVGYWRARSDDLHTTFDGAGISFDIAVGGAIRENLVLFGNYFGAIHPESRRSLDRSDDTMTLGVLGIGPGLAYYIMPINLYVSGTVAVIVAPKDTSTYYDTPDMGVGFGGKLMVGRDWWVSDNWSLGVAADLLLAGTKGNDNPHPGWMITTFGASFVATYN